MGESEIQFEKFGKSYRLNTWLQFGSADRDNFFIIFHCSVPRRIVQQ